MRPRWGGEGRLGDVRARRGQWRGGWRLYKGGRGQAERRHFAGTKGRSGSGPAREGGGPNPAPSPASAVPEGSGTLPGPSPASAATPACGHRRRGGRLRPASSTTFLPPFRPPSPLHLSEPRWSAAAEIPPNIRRHPPLRPRLRASLRPPAAAAGSQRLGEGCIERIAPRSAGPVRLRRKDPPPLLTPPPLHPLRAAPPFSPRPVDVRPSAGLPPHPAGLELHPKGRGLPARPPSPSTGDALTVEGPPPGRQRRSFGRAKWGARRRRRREVEEEEEERKAGRARGPRTQPPGCCRM